MSKLLAPDYKTSFATGQGGGIANYDAYPQDHDGNYLAIQAVVNAHDDQLIGIQGVDVLLPKDAILSTSPAVLEGVMGEHSYDATLSAPDSIIITAGAVYTAIAGRLTTVGATLSAAGIGGAADPKTIWCYVTTSGSVALSATAAAGVLDLYSFEYTDATPGPEGVANLTRLCDVLPDGDDFHNCRVVAGHADAGAPPQTHLTINARLENLERMLRAVTTNAVAGATALGRIAVGGTVGAPGLIMGNGTTFEKDTGLYREGIDQIAAAVVGVKAWGLDATGFMDLPTQARCVVTVSAMASFANGGDDVEFDNEVVDVGAMWAIGSPDEVVVPTGADGFYAIVGAIGYDESTAAGGGTANAGAVRAVTITVGGTNLLPFYATERRPHTSGDTDDNNMVVVAMAALSAGNIIRLNGNHDNGGTMTVGGYLTAVKLC